MEQNNLQPKSGKLRLHEGVELPIDGLPIKVQAFINEVVRCYCCPIEFPTVAVIASASTVIGRRVKIFDGIYTNPLMLWFVNVANSGTNKTAPVKRAIKPLSIINSENYATYKPELDTWRANKERDESNPPKYDQLLINDSTEEARTQVLKSSTTGVLAHHPEIKGFFDDLDRYNKSGSISRVLRLFDGDELIVNRKGDPEPTIISDPFMNIVGDIQPSLLSTTFGSDLFLNNGLNQRFLFAMPKIVEYPRRHEFHFDEDIMRDWEMFVRSLYFRDYNSFNRIYLSEGSNQLYTEYHDNLQQKKEQNTDNGYLVSIFSKLQIQVERLAGIVHLMEMVEPRKPYDYGNISIEAMEYAIRCMAYFEQSAISVYERICGTDFGSPLKGFTQAEIIRDFHEKVGITNLTKFAEGISKTKGYISPLLKGCKRKLPGK